MAWLYAAIMVKVILALIAITAVVAGAALTFLWIRRSTGLPQLERTQRAIRQAKSWTVESIAPGPDANFVSYKYKEKISCPYEKEFSTKGERHDGTIVEQSTIIIRDYYYVKIGDRAWQKKPRPETPEVILDCGRGPFGKDFLQVGELKLRGKVIRGGMRTVGEVDCREWKVDFGYKWPPMDNYTVCIDAKTDLPSRVVYTDTGATTLLTDWNATTIVPPPL